MQGGSISAEPPPPEAGHGGVVLELQAADGGFELSTAVCSHGLFMMAPNRWDPSTRSLHRPLRLPSSSSSVHVSISQPEPSSPWIQVSVAAAAGSLSTEDQEAVLVQVRRMMRISPKTDRAVLEFQSMHEDAKARGFGRIFRSPSLFEDMIKCILLCNCQWSRTLSMARALCDLQLELKCDSFKPNTPPQKEIKRKRGKGKNIAMKLETKFTENEELGNENTAVLCYEARDEEVSPYSASKVAKFDASSNSRETGDFPRPEELAKLDVDFLAKRCNLGYRAARILSLAKDITEGKVELTKLEKVCDGMVSAMYEELNEQFSGISGFGPFTRANVLMCMGFYHRIPADTETIRHLKQFHARKCCTIPSVHEDLEQVYGKYAPYQFLAYWCEIWNDYEQRFGKMSEMPCSVYGMITASNMKTKISRKR